MLVKLLLPNVADITLKQIRVENEVILLELTTTTTSAPCPRCQQRSERIHSRYHRKVADLPWAGTPVQWQLQVRRFRCLSTSCEQRIFSEQVPDLLQPFARRSNRLVTALCQVAIALGGEAGCRLARQLGLEASGATLLRILKRAPLPERTVPRRLGVDDWATRKGHSYGTILVDLDQGQVIDLLPDRGKESFVTWLKRHPGVELVTRDRWWAYAEALREAVPEVVQVADRWHLLKNLGEHLRKLFTRCASTIRPLRCAPVESPPATPAILPGEPIEPPTSDITLSDAEQRRAELYAQVCQLHQTGMQQKRIAQEVGLHPKTISRWLRAFNPQLYRNLARRSRLNPYKPYLRERVQAGCENARVLYEEIQAQGYSGRLTMVRLFIATLRSGRKQHTGRVRHSVWDLIFLLLRRTDTLSSEEQALLQQLQALPDPIHTACKLALEFARLLRDRQVAAVDDWLRRVLASGIPELAVFAKGLQRDEVAVLAAFTLPESNGATEGHVNRLKLIKRSMYGRASFDLLRRRVLLAA